MGQIFIKRSNGKYQVLPETLRSPSTKLARVEDELSRAVNIYCTDARSCHGDMKHQGHMATEQRPPRRLGSKLAWLAAPQSHLLFHVGQEGLGGDAVKIGAIAT